MALAALPARFGALEGRVASVEARQGRIVTDLAENTATTDRVEKNTATIVAFVNDVSVVWRVCKVFRKASFVTAKWVTAIAVMVTSVMASLHASGVDAIGWVKGVFR